MKVRVYTPDGCGPRIAVSLGGVEHGLTVEEAIVIRDGIDSAIESANNPLRCWCGELRVHEEWCREHAPRCRSGAHFHGNCACKGTTP